MRVLKNSANMRGVWHLEWSEYDNFVHMLVPLGLKKKSNYFIHILDQIKQYKIWISYKLFAKIYICIRWVEVGGSRNIFLTLAGIGDRNLGGLPKTILYEFCSPHPEYS